MDMDASSRTPYQVRMSSLLTMMRESASALNLTLIKTLPTRHQGSDKPSTLDIILSNQPQQIGKPILQQSSSDHQIVIFRKVAKMKEKVIPIRKARSYAKYSKEEMLSNLNMPVLNKLLWCTDPNYVAFVLTTEINRALNIVAPIKTIQTRKHFAPHLKPDTKALMKERDVAKKKANNTAD